jgi:hypothetical protein
MTTGRYFLPADCRNNQGVERRVGIEIEMSGIDLKTIAKTVQAVFGGAITELTSYELRIENTSMGDFVVEFDSDAVKRLGRELEKNQQVLGELEQWASDAVALLAQNIVPCELSTSPIPFTRISELDSLVEALRQAGAKGTRHSPWSAFGVHFNPELPALDARTIAAYMKAYLCFNDWLIWHEQVSLTRRIPPYINVFPEQYVLKMVDPEYWPELPELIRDYLQINPTRNRILDMLPLFHYLDRHTVDEYVEDELIKARPTLHYRLPNSEIDRPEWSFHEAWNDWMQVELLAQDALRLERWCYRYWLYLQQPMRWPFIVPWKEQIQSCLVDLSLA